METIKSFAKFPEQGNIIGSLLVSYADLELTLLHCVNVALEDFNKVYKTMFRIRGELRRLNKAEELGEKKYRQLGLDDEFETAINSMDCCRIIRNQYAHSIFYDDYSGSLAFVNIETEALKNEKVEKFENLKIHHIDLSTLNKQQQFFIYTNSLLEWINFEGRRIAGKNYRGTEKPIQVGQPPLNIESK